jgi:putative ABC transport system permease protein
MLSATLRAMVAHKLRLVLTTVSIALGVAFLSGTMILTQTMNVAFTQLFDTVSSGTDVVVRAEAAYSQAEGLGTAGRPLDAAVLDTVRSVEGVAAAEGTVTGYALLTDPDGKAIVTSGGAPTLGYSFVQDEGLRGDVSLRSGRPPTSPDEVVIDATSAQEHGLELGSRTRILFQGPARDFEVVGTVSFGDEPDLGGTTSAYFDSSTAQKLLGTPGQFDTLVVRANDEATQSELATDLGAVLPTGLEAVTGQKVSQESADAISTGLGFVSTLFTVFAAIALFVGSFIIWNTFTMIVTQRSREIALLRAIGATRRQVLRSLIAEAVLIGLLASAVGVATGIVVARGLQALMGAVGFSLPTTSMQIEPRTLWLPILVGTLVTVVSALVPARRATRVLPVEALRSAVPGREHLSKKRIVVGALLAMAGVAGILSNLYGSTSFLLFGAGLLATVLGVMTLLPLAVTPIARAIGIPLKLRGMPGELARQNAERNPRRTSATAAALMIGLTLVVSMGVFASSLKTSFGDVLGDSLNADLFIQPASTTAEGFSPEAVDIASSVPGVQVASLTGWGEWRFNGADSTYSSIDPSTAAKVLDLEMVDGSVADLGVSSVAMPKKLADDNGWQVGDTVTSEFAATGKHQLEVVGIYKANTWLGKGPIISNDAQARYAGPQLASSGFLRLDGTADPEEVKAAVTDALAGYPDAKVLDQAGYEAEAGGFINQLLTFVTVMLLLAVLIALLGIVNTLALAVFERTRELGLLRAVGMTRGQVRAMVRWESVVISLIGATSGAALGIGLGISLAQALRDEGIRAISVPGPQIAVYVALAAVAGVLAALGPARSAAKVDVLRAVVTD